MREDQLLQQALSAARAGRELTARDIFLEIVELNPGNEVAWMWLTGLLDNLDDCIYACERVLDINPANDHARQYLSRLLAEKQKELDAEKLRTEEELHHIQELAKAGKSRDALDLLRNLTAGTVVSAEAWSLLAKLSSDLNEQIHALEKLLELEPGDAQAGQELQRLRHFQNNPMDLAAMYEERGELDKAITTYGLASMNPKSRGQWESIYWKIARLENLRQEKIAHISPSISVARLTAGPPVLYLSLMLVQVGINPFAEPDPILWLGLLWVLLGALMVALAAVRSRHRLWFLLFKDLGAGGSPAARMLVSLAGWILILLPHVLLVLVAYDRLIDSIVLWIQ